jgi:VHL beta domain
MRSRIVALITLLVFAVTPGVAGATAATGLDLSGTDSLNDSTAIREGRQPACSNRRDDDRDGTVDYRPGQLGDPGCTSRGDRSERGSITCDNGIDDDLDGKTDYSVVPRLRDPDCTDPTDAVEEAMTVLPEKPPSACSLVGDTPTSVTFQNNFVSVTVAVYWVDYACNEVLYATLSPGTGYTQPSWVTHPWRVREQATHGLLVDAAPLGPDAIKITVP